MFIASREVDGPGSLSCWSHLCGGSASSLPSGSNIQTLELRMFSFNWLIVAQSRYAVKWKKKSH